MAVYTFDCTVAFSTRREFRAFCESRGCRVIESELLHSMESSSNPKTTRMRIRASTVTAAKILEAIRQFTH